MKKRNFVALSLCAAMTASSLAACGSSAPAQTVEESTAKSEESTESAETQAAAETAADAADTVEDFGGAELEMVTRLSTDGGLTELKALCDSFGEKYNCTITLTEYGNEYESILKTRMASNEMPDLLETHGWSRLRYGEYLEPVQNESWYQYQSDVAKGVLEGDGEDAYALMLTASVVGMVWNKTVCEENGIDLYAVETYDDVIEVCQKLIDAGLVPIGSRGSADDMADFAGVFCSYPDAPDAAAQLDGSWDWASYKQVTELWAKLIDMGALWEDVATMDSTATKDRITSGSSVFTMANGIGLAATYAKTNPEYEYVSTPFPAVTEGVKRYAGCGEGYAVGVYNESEHKDAAMKFLEYMATEGGELASVVGGYQVISSIEMDNTTPVQQAYQRTMDEFPDTVYVNLWDREYMPNGMWSVFSEAAGMLFSDTSEENQQQVIAYLKTAYDEKYAADHPEQ